MQVAKAGFAAAVLAAVGLALAAPAQARDGHHFHRRGFHEHGRIHYGFYFGAPLWGPSWYYPPPYYYDYPRVVVVPTEPPVYVERGEQPSSQPAQSWWYYCPESKTYYPYVKSCPGGWQKVAPESPPQ